MHIYRYTSPSTHNDAWFWIQGFTGDSASWVLTAETWFWRTFFLHFSCFKKNNLEFLITFWHFSIGFLTTGKRNGFAGTLPWPDEDKALGMFGSEGWANDHYIYESIFDDMDWDGDIWNHEKYFWDQYGLGWGNKKATKSIAVSPRMQYDSPAQPSEVPLWHPR